MRKGEEEDEHEGKKEKVRKVRMRTGGGEVGEDMGGEIKMVNPE